MLNDFVQLVQYSGPKRFLTSVGIILVVLSIFLPWLIINQAIAFDMKQADYDQLMQLSQYNVLARQIISLILIVTSCCISPILVFFGISFATISFWAWFFFGDSEKDKKPTKPEKNHDNTPSFVNPGPEESNKPLNKNVTQSPLVIPNEVNRNVKINSYALFKQKSKEILISQNFLRPGYSFESDDWFDGVLSSHSEAPDYLIKTEYIYKSDLWATLRFYGLLIKEWADHNDSRNAKAIGIVLYPKLSLPTHIAVWLLNSKRLLIFFKLDITIVLLAEKMINDKNITSLYQRILPVRLS